MFRVEGVSRRRVADHRRSASTPRCAAAAHGAALLRSAAHVARAEYARGAVLAASVGEPGVRAAARRARTRLGPLDDVRLA